MNHFRFLVFILIIFGGNFAALAQSHWESIVVETDTFKYIVPATEPSNNWMQLNYDDTSWDSSIGGFGFEDGDDNTIINSPASSVYLRKKIIIPESVSLKRLVLDIDYDDAFVLYLNGIEVSRSSNLSAGVPSISGSVTAGHEATMYSGGKPERFLLDTGTLNVGVNILAVHIMNYSTSSSDLSARIFLSAELEAEQTYFHTTPLWFNAPLNFDESNLPLIKINTNGAAIVDEPKITAQMQVINNANGINNFNDTVYEYNGYIGIEIRGNTAQLFDKKSFAVETRLSNGENLNVSLTGLPEENDWVLYGPYSDKSLMRDALAYYIGNSMNNGWHPRTRFVEMEINDEYRGIYMVTEKIKIDKNRVNIANLQGADTVGDELTGGYIISIDRDQEGSWNSPFMGRTGSVDVPFSYVDPEYDDLTIHQRNYIRNYITDFEYALHDSNYKDTITGYRPYIDILTFIDYFIITELSKNLDGYRVSVYFHKDKDSKDGRLKMTPFWDYNLCFGNANFFSAGISEGWASDGIGAGDWYEIPFWWDKFRTDPYFEALLKYRWSVLRNSVINTSTINNFIDSVANTLAEAQVRNFEKFDILNTYVWPNNYIGGSYENEIGYLKDWINRRITWMDSQIDEIVPQSFRLSDIETLPASEIKYNQSIIGGKITNNGGSYVWERGFYWSDKVYPIENGKKLKAGTGSGSFTSALTELLPNKQYYFVAYAKNDIGTSYGETNSFITLDDDTTSTIALHKFSEQNITTYPNPFSDNVTIEIELENNCRVDIYITNILGEKVDIKSRYCNPGTNLFLLNEKNFQSINNLYFYNILIDGVPVYRGKLVKL